VGSNPFQLAGERLHLNVDARTGQIQVEILDVDGNPIPGFTANDASAYENVDQLRLTPRWKNHADLSSLAGKVVRLRIRLTKAKLYSLQIL
jgi:hypothetical protein